LLQTNQGEKSVSSTELVRIGKCSGCGTVCTTNSRILSIACECGSAEKASLEPAFLMERKDGKMHLTTAEKAYEIKKGR
jgi:hypothetical protein